MSNAAFLPEIAAAAAVKSMRKRHRGRGQRKGSLGLASTNCGLWNKQQALLGHHARTIMNPPQIENGGMGGKRVGVAHTKLPKTRIDYTCQQDGFLVFLVKLSDSTPV